MTSATGTLPETEVNAMFDRVAGGYDRLNTVMSVGLDRHWRRRAADLARVSEGDSVLDVATGTGELAAEMRRRVGPDARVVGLDFSDPMLDLARAKAPGIEFVQGSALELPFADDEFAACTVGFSARNYADLSRGLSEMARVVAPGGRVVVLEMTAPQDPPLSFFFRLWFDQMVPVLGRLAADREAYTYLPNSVRRFPLPEVLAGELAAVGLVEVGWVLTAGGIIALHHGTVPEPS